MPRPIGDAKIRGRHKTGGERVLAWHETCLGLCCSQHRARLNGSLVEEAGTEPPLAVAEFGYSRMSVFDLIKATVVCGVIAFLIYSYPVIGQIVLIGFLSLLWLLYAHRTIAYLRRK